MIIPAKIDIQLVDRDGKPNPLQDLLFGLKIFTSGGSWHNYSVFKSDVSGHISLTKQDIINNTGLKWEKGDFFNGPTKFELYAWNGPDIEQLIKATELLLTLYNDKDFIERDLKAHGVATENIPAAIAATSEKSIEDRVFYELIKNAVNNSVQVDTNKIEGVWTDSFQKMYRFVVDSSKLV